MATATLLPPDVESLARAHRRRQQQIAAAATAQSARLWAFLDLVDLAGSWAALSPLLLRVATAALVESSRGAQDYVAAAVRYWGAEPDPAGAVAESTFARTASDGRPLATLLDQPLFEMRAFVEQGMAGGQAQAVGGRHLSRIVATQVTDAARVATGVAQVNDRAVHGWVRMLTPPSCSRCIVLAGKFYRTNTGFQRHPLCDCVHIPSVEDLPDLATDPNGYFDSLTERQQDQTFTVAGARAIRDGADVAQVVNARRELRSVTVAGRQVDTTTVGVTRRGLAGQRLGARRGSPVLRLTPESIYAEAQRLGWSRDETIAQLKRFGYIV